MLNLKITNSLYICYNYRSVIEYRYRAIRDNILQRLRYGYCVPKQKIIIWFEELLLSDSEEFTSLKESIGPATI